MSECYCNDEWTLKDRLGYESLIKQILNVIKNAKPPFTLGIYGGWGSGKTSIMRQLFFRIGGELPSVLLPFCKSPDREKLDSETEKIIKQWQKDLKNEAKKSGKLKDKKYKNAAIWFNPWQHQFDKEPIIGLLHEIRENFNLFSKASSEAQKLANVTIRGGVDMLTGLIKELTKINIGPDKIEKYGTTYETDNFMTKSSSQRFRLLFEKAVSKLINGDGNRLIIFIDDLDRCTDEHIIKLLEGIKLYLSTSNCIFIFGMDQRNVIRALAKQKIHREYLGKLFQSTIRIPLSKNYEKLIQDIADSYFPSGSSGQSGQLSKLLSDILEKNPRKVKNFLNSLRAYWEMLDNKDDLKIEIASLFHYFRICYEPIFTVLERNPDYVKNLVAVCKNEPANCKLEHLFHKHLRNPITEIAIPSTSESEDTVMVPVKLEKEEMDYMEETSVNYEALDKFKEHFVKYSEDYQDQFESTILLKYLGVIGNE